MLRLVKSLAVTLLCQLLLAPLPVSADDEVPTEKEVMQAEGVPPVIPHRVLEDYTTKTCLGCHETGKKGAPVTPHPERQNCTQCHVPKDGFAPAKGLKKK
jgi:nitrate reductase (cytochrome), electron transfer subunit